MHTFLKNYFSSEKQNLEFGDKKVVKTSNFSAKIPKLA